MTTQFSQIRALVLSILGRRLCHTRNSSQTTTPPTPSRNPVIAYYQTRRRQFHQDDADIRSEIYDGHSLRQQSQLPPLPPVTAKDDDFQDNQSLRDCIVECKSAKFDGMSLHDHKTERFPERFPERISERFPPLKRAGIADDACSVRSLSRLPATARKELPFRVTLTKLDDDARSLCLSISTSNGLEPLERRLMQPIQKHINREITRNVKSALKPKNLSESDLYLKLRQKSYKPAVAAKTPTKTKQLLRDMPLPEVRPCKAGILVPSSPKKRPKEKTYIWSKVPAKRPVSDYGFTPRSVTNITQHLMQRQQKTGGGSGAIREKSSDRMKGEEKKSDGLSSNDGVTVLNPRNFLKRIMSFYKKN